MLVASGLTHCKGYSRAARVRSRTAWRPTRRGHLFFAGRRSRLAPASGARGSSGCMLQECQGSVLEITALGVVAPGSVIDLRLLAGPGGTSGGPLGKPSRYSAQLAWFFGCSRLTSTRIGRTRTGGCQTPACWGRLSAGSWPACFRPGPSVIVTDSVKEFMGNDHQVKPGLTGSEDPHRAGVVPRTRGSDRLVLALLRRGIEPRRGQRGQAQGGASTSRKRCCLEKGSAEEASEGSLHGPSLVTEA